MDELLTREQLDANISYVVPSVLEITALFHSPNVLSISFCFVIIHPGLEKKTRPLFMSFF